jgi:hypothetical protein
MMAVLSVVDAKREKVLSNEDLVKLEYTDDTFLTMRNADDIKLKWVAIGMPGYVKCVFLQKTKSIAYIKLTNKFVPTILNKAFTIKKGDFYLSRAINPPKT